MESRKRYKRIGLPFLLVLAVLAGSLGWLTYRQIRQDKLNRMLIAAIKQNDLRGVSTTLEQGASPNAAEMPADTRPFWKQWLDQCLGRTLIRKGECALSLAAAPDLEDLAIYHGNSHAVVRLLLEKGANPNVMDTEGNPVLHQVAEYWKEDSQLIRLLLGRGADPNARDRDGWTALMIAVHARHPEMAKLLIARVGKTGINAVTNDGTTALMVAAWEGNGDNPAVVQALLDASADLNAHDEEGNTALEKATFVDCHAGWSSPHIMRVLLAHGIKVNKHHCPALFGAAHGKKVAALRILLDAGVDINQRDEDGYTPLMIAVQPPDYPEWGSVSQCVRLLLTRGANPNIKAWDGQTALKMARQEGTKEIVQLLNRAGAKE